MSAEARYRKLECKVKALEAAGLGAGQEAELARASMAEVRPLLDEAKAASLILESQGAQGKIAESAPVTVPADEAPKQNRSRAARAKPEGALTDQAPPAV